MMRHFEMMAANFLEQICLNERRRRELIPIAQQTAEDKVRQWQRHEQVRIRRTTTALKERRRGELKGKLLLCVRSVEVQVFKRRAPGPFLATLWRAEDTSHGQLSPHEIKRQIWSGEEIARQQRVE